MRSNSSSKDLSSPYSESHQDRLPGAEAFHVRGARLDVLKEADQLLSLLHFSFNYFLLLSFVGT